ncbi:hypothetical protein ACFLQQ_01330 [Actinomycetota bacterium]
MNDKYNMQHASKMAKKWKIIIILTAVLAGASIIFVLYLYFPIISGFIDRGIDYLFKPPDGIEQQNEEKEDNIGDAGENDTEEEIVEEQEEEPEETQEEIPGEEDEEEPDEAIEEEAEEEPDEEEEIVEQGVAPTVVLRIYEGPSYSKSDDICYYRVTADISGDPFPKVTFNKDDSLGSLGTGKAQINITRDSQSFTLNATAENSEGRSSDSIVLNWNCNRSPDIAGISLETDALYINEEYEVSVEVVDLDGDVLLYSWSVDGGGFDDAEVNPARWDTPAEPGDYTISVSVVDGIGNTSESSIVVYVGEMAEEPENFNLPRKESEGGYIEFGGSTNIGGNIYAGDSEDNKPCSGFISFDISGLSGKTVEAASLTLKGASISGDPRGFSDPLTLWINSLDWGAEPIVQSDFNLGGVAIANYDSPNITCNVSLLREELQKAINDGRSRFQIRIHFGGAYTDNDDKEDGWDYSQSNINLNVTAGPE